LLFQVNGSSTNTNTQSSAIFHQLSRAAARLVRCAARHRAADGRARAESLRETTREFYKLL